MSKLRTDILTTFLIVLSFGLIIYAHLSFDFTVDPKISNEYNDFAFNMDALGKFILILAFFIYSGGLTKAFVRVYLMARLFATLNELIGLNNTLDNIQFPIFWSVMIVTAITSYLKYEPTESK